MKKQKLSVGDALGATKTPPSSTTPLAEAMRPQDLDSYLGQENSVGPGTQMRALIQAEHIPSLILWGPPGCYLGIEF
jgi:replication-associated recombination protein RarA